jgi:hypothetical protein
MRPRGSQVPLSLTATACQHGLALQPHLQQHHHRQQQHRHHQLGQHPRQIRRQTTSAASRCVLFETLMHRYDISNASTLHHHQPSNQPLLLDQ